MAGEELSIKPYESGIYTIQSVEQLDALIASANASGRVITIKDPSSIEIHEAALEQLSTQHTGLIGASPEQLSQFRKDLLLKAQLTEPANQAAAQLLQGENAKTLTTSDTLARPVAEHSADFAKQAFEAAAQSFTQDVVQQYSKVTDKELLSDVVNWAEQFDFENKKQVQLEDPSNKDYFAFRDRHPVGKDYDTHKREYIDSLKEACQAFIATKQRLPSSVETLTLAANALLAGYENFIKNEVFNSKISKLSPQEQEQFHDLKARLGGDADQALQEGAIRLAVSRRFSNLLGQELSIVRSEPITISNSIGRAGQKQITKELENSIKDPTVVGALSTHKGLPDQFVLDSNRSIYKFIEAGETHTSARNREAVTQGLNTFVRGNEKAAFALAAVANQATLGSLYKAYVVGSVPDYKLVPAPAAREADPVGYTLERLPNNNVRLHAYQLQGLRTLELVPAKPRSTLPSLSLLAAREPEDTQIDESNYGVRGNVEIELDGKALEKGKLQIVRHAPYTLDVRLKLDWDVTAQVFTG